MNIDGSFRFPRAAAVIFGVFWSVFSALGLYVLVAYHKERLFVSGERIRQRGCFRARTIQFSDLRGAKWRIGHGGGSLVLRSADCRVVIYFDNFSPDEREELIRFFRRAVPEAAQQNGAAYESWYFQPPGTASARQRRAHAALGLLVLGFAAFFALTDKLIPGKPRNLPLAAVNALCGILFLWTALRTKPGNDW